MSMAVLLVLPACDNDGSDDDNNGLQQGTYTATISGATNTDLSGIAASAGNAAAAGWGLALGSAGAGIIFTSAGDRPGNGTYTIVPISQASSLGANQFTATAAVVGTSDQYGSTMGTLTIESSSSTRVEGRFSFTAESIFTAGQTVTVSGNFNSTNVDG